MTDSVNYWSMNADSKFMTTNMKSWDWMWREEHEPSDIPRFGSLFRIPDGLPEYHGANLKPNGSGQLVPSFAGWDEGLVGMVAVDIDCSEFEDDGANLADALRSAQRIIAHLRRNSVQDRSYVPFLSGKKGISIHLYHDAFGPSILAVQPGFKLDGKNTVNRGHKRAAYLALEAVCNGEKYDIGCYQTLRLFRIPNSKHDKTNRYKIPLMIDEIMTMPPGDMMELAKKPRLVGTLPSDQLDPVLQRMFEEKLKLANEIDAEMSERSRLRKAALPSGTLNSPAQQSGMPGPLAQDPVPLSPDLLQRLQDLLPTHPWLRQAWNSIPRPGRNNSESEFDFRLCVELFILGWPREHVTSAMLSRPSSSSPFRRTSYIERTLDRAKTYASAQRLKRPIERILSTTVERAVAEYGNPWYSWAKLSNLWRVRKGVGKSCRDVYMHHLEVAVTLGLKQDNDGWYGPYYLPRSDISGADRRCCHERTMDKAHVILEAIGLLQRIETGGLTAQGKIATTYRIRTFCPDEEELLTQAGRAAMKHLKDGQGRLRLGRNRRKAAQRAGKMVLSKFLRHANGTEFNEDDPGT